MKKSAIYSTFIALFSVILISGYASGKDPTIKKQTTEVSVSVDALHVEVTPLQVTSVDNQVMIVAVESGTIVPAVKENFHISETGTLEGPYDVGTLSYKRSYLGCERYWCS